MAVSQVVPRRSYEVLVTRLGADWFADIPTIPEWSTRVSTLDMVEQAVMDTITAAVDLPPGAAVDLVFEYRTGDPQLDRRTADVRARRRAAQAAADEVHTMTATTVAALTARGWSKGDAAALLGVPRPRSRGA